MSPQTPITYRDFYDLPRIFLVTHEGLRFLFDCKFDDDFDDYPDFYKVFLMPPLQARDLNGSWDQLSASATKYLGDVSVNAVKFDSTRRKSIDVQVIRDLLKNDVD